MNRNGIEVSVICTTYNHEQYLERCLESLVRQKTNFRYEIIVHDDASTDGTHVIIEKYKKLYDKLIIPIIQPRNIYSQGIPLKKVIEPYISGRYIASCEGDDFWTSDQKLQAQFDYMEQHAECTAVTHASKEFNNRLNCFSRTRRPSQSECDLKIDDIVKNWSVNFATNSMFYRREYYALPDEFLGWGVGDYPQAIYLAGNGPIHSLPYTYSAYRTFVKNSWTSKQRNRKVSICSHEKLVSGLEKANKYFKYKYDSLFKSQKRLLELQILSLKRSFIQMNGSIIQERPLDVSLRNIVSLNATCLLPDGVLKGIKMFREKIETSKNKNARIRD